LGSTDKWLCVVGFSPVEADQVPSACVQRLWSFSLKGFICVLCSIPENQEIFTATIYIQYLTTGYQ
jgi:hypothetical protein